MFTVSTAHATSVHSEAMEIPLFPCFQTDGIHKFYLFDFSPKFDGLIGIDFLIQIGASINLKTATLETPNAELPLYFQHDLSQYNAPQKPKFVPVQIIIPPRTTQIVKVPVTEQNGVGILHYTDFEVAEIPEALVNVTDFQALTMITNSRENPVKIKILEPLKIEMINESEMNFVDKMQINSDIDEQHLDKLHKQNLKNLRLEHCNPEEYKAIRDLCYEYRDIFYCEGTPLTFTNQIKHKINLTDETPIFTKTYRYPEIHRKEVHTQINKMLQDGIIQNSTSPWSSPIWVVPKKLDASGKRKWRIVVDYRKLNQKTIDDKFPLPNITDILDKLGKAQYFTTLDLANGFHQIEMHKDDIPKTAFSTDTGLYEFRRMPFGLKNAPSTFQRVMNNVLRGFQNEICLVYLDDIIIFSTSLQEHVQRLKLVFERLRQSKFKIQLDKSEFLHKEIAYLGHKVTENGITPNPDKIEAVKNFPVPKTPKEIKAFLGLAGYYRRFIKDFAKISKPLTSCLKKNAKIEHTPSFLQAFNHLKELLINAPILKYPDFSKPFVLTTDASNFALGAILSQGTPPKDQPIAFASRTLNETEQRYSTIEKELLAIVWSCKYFRPYLYGRKFQIFTDHRPLVWLFNLKEPNSKLMRWRLKLEEYDYEIIYKKGKHNLNADALSRIRLNAVETQSILNNPGDINFDIEEFLDQNYDPNTLDPNEVSETLKMIEPAVKEPKFRILQNIQIRPPISNTSNTAHSANVPETLADIPILDEIINNKIQQLIVTKSPYDSYQKINRENFDGNKIIKATIPANITAVTKFMKEYLQDKTNYIYFVSKELRPLFQQSLSNYFRNYKLIECTKLVNNVQPDERELLILHKHEGKTNHRGIDETYKFLKANYYWKSMKADITKFINNCELCQRTKYDRKPPKQPLVLTETPSRPFEIIHIDTFVLGKYKFLTILDKFSKFGHALPYFGTAISACQQLVHFFSFHGIPKQIVADNGTEFKNDVVDSLLKVHGIKIHFTTPYHHESNSPVERLHSTLLEHIRLLKEKDPKADTPTLMSYAVIAYNSTIHSTTNYTPFELITGHTDSKDPMSLIPARVFSEYVNSHQKNTEALYEQIKEDTSRNKEKLINKINQSKKSQNLSIGARVYKKTDKRTGKIKNKFKGPFILTKILENNKIEIENPVNQNKEIIHVNEAKIIPIFPDGPGPSRTT